MSSSPSLPSPSHTSNTSPSSSSQTTNTSPSTLPSPKTPETPRPKTPTPQEIEAFLAHKHANNHFPLLQHPKTFEQPWQHSSTTTPYDYTNIPGSRTAFFCAQNRKQATLAHQEKYHIVCPREEGEERRREEDTDPIAHIDRMKEIYRKGGQEDPRAPPMGIDNWVEYQVHDRGGEGLKDLVPRQRTVEELYGEIDADRMWEEVCGSEGGLRGDEREVEVCGKEKDCERHWRVVGGEEMVSTHVGDCEEVVRDIGVRGRRDGGSGNRNGDGDDDPDEPAEFIGRGKAPPSVNLAVEGKGRLFRPYRRLITQHRRKGEKSYDIRSPPLPLGKSGSKGKKGQHQSSTDFLASVR